MKLKFGDPQSIQLRDKALEENTVAELIKIVKCRFCKAPADHCFEFDIESKVIGWNFKCKPSCQNSYQYAEKHGYDHAKLYTNLKGKNIDW